MKQCSRCKEIKPILEFSKHKRMKDGLSCCCKICKAIDDKKYYENNSERLIANTLKWQKDNPEKANIKSLKWCKDNPEKYKQKSAKWQKENPGKCNANCRKRQSAKIQATPPWLTKEDFKQIEALYIKAKELEKLDGIKRHVDHIVPLQGKTVCGLHILINLQILTAEENMNKNNKLEII